MHKHKQTWGLLYKQRMLNHNAKDVAERHECGYAKAAEQGDCRCTKLAWGHATYEGKGTLKNPAEAVKWFRKGRRAGGSDAQYSLGCCYENGVGEKKDVVFAICGFNLSDKAGKLDAKTHLNDLAKKMRSEQIA